jgi:hypothetical protein
VFFDGQDMTKLVVTESDVLTRFLNAKRGGGLRKLARILLANCCVASNYTEPSRLDSDMIDRDHHLFLDATPV